MHSGQPLVLSGMRTRAHIFSNCVSEILQQSGTHLKASVRSHGTSTGLSRTFQASKLGKCYIKTLFRSSSNTLATSIFRSRVSPRQEMGSSHISRHGTEMINKIGPTCAVTYPTYSSHWETSKEQRCDLRQQQCRCPGIPADDGSRTPGIIYRQQ